jgi:hypothetical protein
MSSSAIAFHSRRKVPSLGPAQVRERSIRRRVGIAWALLVLNCLTYYGSVVHIPSVAGKLIQQGALPLALLVALSINRRVVVRPNVFLCLASALVLEAIVTTLQPQYVVFPVR